MAKGPSISVAAAVAILTAKARSFREYMDQMEKSRTQPIASCSICEGDIDATQEYSMVPLGYAHDSCREFLKTQREIRASEKSE